MKAPLAMAIISSQTAAAMLTGHFPARSTSISSALPEWMEIGWIC